MFSMDRMKSTEADIRFPALGFTPDREIWGFADIDALTECGSRTLMENMQAGMEIIDSDGRRWLVRSIRRIGRNKPLLPWLLWRALSGPGWRIEQELEEMAPVTLTEIAERACASLEAFADDYCLGREREDILTPLIAKVRSAESVAAIREVVGPDWFIAY